jgi:hypothetical protein
MKGHRMQPLNMISATYFNATREELERSGESLENVAELKGGGYLSSLGVYHEVHCLVSAIPIRLSLLTMNWTLRQSSDKCASSYSKIGTTRSWLIPTWTCFVLI